MSAHRFDLRGALRAVNTVGLLLATASNTAVAFQGTLFAGVLPFGGWIACVVLWIWLRNDDDRRCEAVVRYDSAEV